MLNHQDLQLILRVIYDPNTTYESRKEAETKLNNFQNLQDSWKIHIDLISSVSNSTSVGGGNEVDEHMLFLLCFGLNKILWKNWSNLSAIAHETISQSLVQLLTERFHKLPLYARSKVEQVIATICKNSVSYDLGFQLVNVCNNSSLSPIIALSAFRTILEEVLSNDNRISPENRLKLSKDAYEMAPQLVSMSCNTCVNAIQSNNTITLNISLNLLKVIISKIQIGPHINNDTLNLLFMISELASSSSAYNEPSLNAVETLSEFMSRRYIPPNTEGGVQAKEAVASTLVNLVAKAVNLIRKYCSIQDADESPIILALLQFISTFAECHLERCISAAVNNSQLVLSQITLLLRELAVLSCLSSEPHYLLKIAEMWEVLLSLETLKGQLLQAESETNNLLLYEMLDELEDDFIVEPLVDPHIRGLIASVMSDDSSLLTSGSSGGSLESNNKDGNSNSSQSNSSKLHGTEENMCVGTSLRMITKLCIAELIGSPDAFACFSQSLTLMMQQSLQALGNNGNNNINNNNNNGNNIRRKQVAAALDICYCIQLLPLCTPSVELFALLCPLITQLMESRIYAQGKAFIGVIITSLQVAGQIIQSIGNVLNSKNSGQNMVNSTNIALAQLPYIMKCVELACDIHIAPSPFTIMISTSAFLLQSLTSLLSRCIREPSLNTQQAQEVKQILIQSFTISIMPHIFSLPLEVHALLLCSADQLMPQTSENLSQDLYNLTVNLCTTQAQDPSMSLLTETTNMLLLSRYCASLDALARHYSVSIAIERQRFITSISTLQQCIAPLMKACIDMLIFSTQQKHSSFASASSIAKFNSIIHICTFILSLTSGLQQSLGKKTFGTSSLLIFEYCVSALSATANFTTTTTTTAATGNGNSGSNSSGIMMNTSGLLFIKNILQLSTTIALASSASDVNIEYQVKLTVSLVEFICSYLSDPHICAELLHDTLKAGITAIGCYWKADDPRVFSSSFSSSPSSSLSPPACYPIISLLTQLFVGSMSATVNPVDAQVAIEGMNELNDKHHIFSTSWFKTNGSWMSVLVACLRSVTLVTHPSHVDSLVEILTKLQLSDISQEDLQSSSLLTSSFITATAATNTTNASSGNYHFWTLVCNETYRLAVESHVEETAAIYLNALITRYPSFMKLDMTCYVAYVIHPITADIAKITNVTN